MKQTSKFNPNLLKLYFYHLWVYIFKHFLFFVYLIIIFNDLLTKFKT